ncbi:MAG: dimethylsulfonioproprionate lyase family protein [Pseudomonadota bacterium]
MQVAERLAAAVQDLLADVPEADAFRSGWPDLRATRPQVPGQLPVCAVLPTLADHAAPQTAALVAAVIDAAPMLEWRQTYGPDDFGPAFLQGYGWTELIGLRGPIPGTTLAMGFLLLGPGIAYPPHAHEASELYLPLAGTALWQQGGADFTAVPPGRAILHAPWVPHATTTTGQGVLALYLWRGGDLAAKSRIVGR